MNFKTPLELRSFRDRKIYIKRDDLISEDFSGNKARKFEYFLNNDFPGVKRVVSYGSNQSNAMYSLSVLAKIKGWEFLYFCDHIPSFLNSPTGNYKYALQNGMKIFISTDREKEANSLVNNETIVIQEGGRQKQSEYGLKRLADELKDDISTCRIENPYIFLPSGTGVTALYLQKHLECTVVYTCATVGSSEYLIKQWNMVEEKLKIYPKILESKKRYHYGKLYPEAYAIYSELKEDMGVEFDLLYDPIGWIKFLENIENLDGTPIYLHQGGLKGNESMKARYERKYGKIR